MRSMEKHRGIVVFITAQGYKRAFMDIDELYMPLELIYLDIYK